MSAFSPDKNESQKQSIETSTSIPENCCSTAHVCRRVEEKTKWQDIHVVCVQQSKDLEVVKAVSSHTPSANL